VIQPPIVDFRETNGSGAAAATTGGGTLPDRSHRQNAAAALVASVECCSEPTQNGRALQTDIREIRRIIKAYVGRLQDREITNHVAKEWRIVHMAINPARAVLLEISFFFLLFRSIRFLLCLTYLC